MELFTRTWGSPAAPAVVLLHGASGNGGTRQEFAGRHQQVNRRAVNGLLA